MTDNKLKDNEIIKALECCCKNNNCEGCPLDYLTFSSQCASELAIKSLDLINRLQAQNKDLAETVHNLTLEKDALFDKAEELKAEVERLKEFIVETRRCDKEIKSEAYKEFAERLKEKSFQSFGNYGITRDVVEVCDIDNLVKELNGG